MRWIVIYCIFKCLSALIRRSLFGVVANVLDCDIEVSDFELHSLYYIHSIYNNIDTTAAWKKLHFISSVRFDFHMTDSLSIAVNAFASCVFMSVSVLLYECTTWTLTKGMEGKLDGNYTRMLLAILNKSWRQHPTKQQLYRHLALITKAIKIRQTRHARLLEK